MYAQTVHTLEPNGTTEPSLAANDSINEGAGTTLPCKNQDEVDDDDIFLKRRYTRLHVKMFSSILQKKKQQCFIVLFMSSVLLNSSGKWNLVVSMSAQWLNQSGNHVLWFKL